MKSTLLFAAFAFCLNGLSQDSTSLIPKSNHPMYFTVGLIQGVHTAFPNIPNINYEREASLATSDLSASVVFPFTTQFAAEVMATASLRPDRGNLVSSGFGPAAATLPYFEGQPEYRQEMSNTSYEAYSYRNFSFGANFLLDFNPYVGIAWGANIIHTQGEMFGDKMIRLYQSRNGSYEYAQDLGTTATRTKLSLAYLNFPLQIRGYFPLENGKRLSVAYRCNANRVSISHQIGIAVEL